MTRRFSAKEYSDAIVVAVTSASNVISFCTSGMQEPEVMDDHAAGIYNEWAKIAFKTTLDNEISDLWRKRDEE